MQNIHPLGQVQEFGNQWGDQDWRSEELLHHHRHQHPPSRAGLGDQVIMIYDDDDDDNDNDQEASQGQPPGDVSRRHLWESREQRRDPGSHAPEDSKTRSLWLDGQQE